MFSSSAAAITPEQKKLFQGGIKYYDFSDGCSASSSSMIGGSLDAFLQALAFQESGGKAGSQNAHGSAAGKFQYIQSTWKARAKIYGPAGLYASSKDAPEEIQDAVAYIEYAQAYVNFKGDFAKMAINHYLPLANSDPSKLDVVPSPESGNKFTPREYGEMTLENMKKGSGKDITLKYKQAPEFDLWLSKVQGFETIPSTSSSTEGSGSTLPNSSSGKPTIVLDPGHGGPKEINRTDPQSGLKDGDYQNVPEAANMYDVAQLAKNKLESSGYVVTLTKNDVNQSVFLRDRANIANSANASLAVSIHTQGDRAFGTWQEIYVQKDGLYRGSGGNKVVFNNPELSKKSQEYALKMKEARDKIEVKSGSTVIKDNSFDGREGIEPGNIPFVQLYSTVPWIYLEAGGGGLGATQKETYANAIVEGVKNAIPSTGSVNSNDCSGSSGSFGGTIVETAIRLAWETDGHGGQTSREQAKPDYQKAFDEFYAAKGGGMHQTPYSDCGVFVGTVMRASGADPDYPLRVTSVQQQYLISSGKYEVINQPTLEQLKPGDVLVYSAADTGRNFGHTLIYTGPQSNPIYVASQASLGDHVPEAAKVGSVTSALKKNGVIAARLK